MWSLLVFFAAVAAAALTGSQFSPGDWYEALAKPSWTPPDWLFGPVWTVLYIAIAVAGWLVWRGASRQVSAALVLWVVQLGLNTAWSWLFFGLHRTGLALVDIALLLLVIVAFLFAAWPIRRAASWLFVPYALWVGYAASLNLFIWHFNPTRSAG